MPITRNQKEYPVGIPVNQAVHGGVFIFRARVKEVSGGEVKFRHGGDRLPADRAIGIIAVHQFGKIGRDRGGHPPFGGLDGLDLFGA